MELVVELIAFLVELLLEVTASSLGQRGTSAAAQPVVDRLRRGETKARPAIYPWRATRGLVLMTTLGATLGAVSVLLWSAPVIKSHSAQLASLVLTPVACGVVAWLVNTARASNGHAPRHFDRVAFAMCFAFGFGLARQLCIT